MTMFVNALAEMVLYGSVGVVFVLLLGKLIPVIPKKYICILWYVLAVRFLCPFVLEGPIPAFWEVGKRTDVIDGVIDTDSAYGNQGAGNQSVGNQGTGNHSTNWNTDNQGADNHASGNAGGGSHGTDNRPNTDYGAGNYSTGNSPSGSIGTGHLDTDNFPNGSLGADVYVYDTPFGDIPEAVIHFLLVIWGVGAVIALLVLAYRYLSVAVRLRAATKAGDFFGVDLWECDLPSLPAAFGLFKTRIYIPREFVYEWTKDREYILWHEKMHIARWDARAKMLLYIVLCLHWWNPFVWIMIYAAGKDIEKACDEAVLEKLGAEKKAEYANSLLQYAAGRSGLKLPAFFGESNAKERIKSILKYKKLAGYVSAICIAAVIFLGVCLITRPHSVSSAETDGSAGDGKQTETATNDGKQTETATDDGKHTETATDDGRQTEMPTDDGSTLADEENTADGGQTASDNGQNANGTNTNDDTQGETPTQGNNRPSTNRSTNAHMHYTGYLDECEDWTGQDDFKDCDYDGDGLIDRVYVDHPDFVCLGCDYIEFGNGDRIDISISTEPHIRLVDLTGDGQNEIIINHTTTTATDPLSGVGIIIYRKTEAGYEELKIPLTHTEDERGNVRQSSLKFTYTVVGDHKLSIYCENIDTSFEDELICNEGMWNLYLDTFVKRGKSSRVYAVRIVPENGVNKLQCWFETYDKWNNASLAVTYVYDEGEMKAEKAEFYGFNYYDLTDVEKENYDTQEKELFIKIRRNNLRGGD